MKKCVSSLRTLLRVKSLEERRLQCEMAPLAHKIFWFQARLASLGEEGERAEKEIREARCQGNFSNQHALSAYCHELEETAQHIRKELSTLQARLLCLQQNLANRHQERKIIEKIYHKQYTAWRKGFLERDA